MNVHAQTQNCPRVMQTGDRIFTDPAGQYRWLDADGNPIPNANQADFIPSGEGRFAVEVSGISMPYRFDPNGNKPKILKGKALDFFLKPIADAQITLQGKTVQTDARGEFILPFNATQGRREAVRCNKNGFYTSIRGFHPTDAETLYTQFILSERKVNFTYDAKDGGIFSQPGVWIKLPANGYVDESGKRYKGKVNLSYRSARPGDAHFGALMPGGDFLALNANGQTRALESYGFTEVLLADESGNALQLAPGVTAQLRFLIPEGLRDKAPETMPLWYMNENEGIWREEGSVQKDGLFYTGTVSHFTPWNCDSPFPPSIIKGRVVDCAGKPVQGGIIEVDNIFVCSDDFGRIELKVVANLPVSVRTGSGSFIYTAPGENQELNIGDVEAVDVKGNIFSALATLINTSNKLELYIYTNGMQDSITYSVDEGKTYHAQNQFSFDLDQESIIPSEVWIKFKFANLCTTSIFKTKVVKIRRELTGSCSHFDYNVHDQRDFLGINTYQFGYDKLKSTLSVRPFYIYYLRERLPESNTTPGLFVPSYEDTEIGTAMFNNAIYISPCLQFLRIESFSGSFPESSRLAYLPNLTELHLTISDSYKGLLLDTYRNASDWLQIPSITYLHLEGFKVETSNSDVFQSLKNLQRLSTIRGNGKLIQSALKLPKLQTLNLYGPSLSLRDSLDEIGKSISDHPSLKELEIVSATILPRFIHLNSETNKSIEVLKFEYMSITTLEWLEYIYKLQNLKQFRAIRCGLTVFHGSILKLQKLEVLDLSNTSQIDSDNFALAQYLNRITSIPESIKNLSGTLKELILTGNPIPENERATIQSWLPNTRITW